MKYAKCNLQATYRACMAMCSYISRNHISSGNKHLNYTLHTSSCVTTSRSHWTDVGWKEALVSLRYGTDNSSL